MRNHLWLLTGIVGVLYLLRPREAVALWTRLAYRNQGDAEPRNWMYEAARVKGAILAVLALGSLFKAAEGNDGPEVEAGTMGLGEGDEDQR